MYSKALATQVGPSGVRVNVVSPGLIRNSSVEALAAEQDISSDELLNRTAAALQIPLGRAGSAEKLAAAVVFLLSPDASYLTGSVRRVDGGSFLATSPAGPSRSSVQDGRERPSAARSRD